MPGIPRGCGFWKEKPRLLKLLSLFLSHHSLPHYLKSLFWHLKAELWLFFSFVVYHRKSPEKEKHIGKYTKILSCNTSYMHCVPVLFPLLNFHLECLTLPSWTFSSCSFSGNPYTLPFPGGAVLLLLNNFPRYTDIKKEFLPLRKLWELHILQFHLV